MTLEIRKGYDSKTLLLKNFYFIQVFLRSESPNITTIYKVGVKYGIINSQACLSSGALCLTFDKIPLARLSC